MKRLLLFKNHLSKHTAKEYPFFCLCCTKFLAIMNKEPMNTVEHVSVKQDKAFIWLHT